MSAPITCPFCGFATEADEGHVMVQHIELDHSESNTPPCPEPEPAPEKSGEAHAERQQHGRSEPSRNRSHATASASHRRRPSPGMEEEREERDGERRKRAQRPPRSTVRGSSSQPSVIQAWKDLFNHGSKSSSRDRGSASHSQRVRHKSKLDYKLREESAAAKARTSASRERGAASTTTTNTATSQERATLGKSELGRHHDEKHMPTWLVSLLGDSQGVCGKRIIPVLHQLLELNTSTQYAYLASPLTQHVSKLRREGSFCGYRNIQMLVSYIIASGIPGAQLFGDTFPTIFEIQDLIEDAWDAGYNTQGRAETGGIRGTRKYIGTPEAQALFSSLNIACPVQAFKDGDQARAKAKLMKAVEIYFRRGAVDEGTAGSGKVHATDLPPIYLQHRGHSLTIVGIEKQRDKGVNLLVFDPSFRDPSSVKDLVDETVKISKHKIGGLLDAYRRGTRYFRRYGEFEILYLTPTAPEVN